MVRVKCRWCREPAVRDGLCAGHLLRPVYVDRARKRAREAKRAGRKRGRRWAHPLKNDPTWRRLSRAWLAAHPWCARCLARPARSGGGMRRPAEHVDHILPVAVAPDRQYDDTNLQSLCRRCHSIKTAREAHGRCYDYARRVVHVIGGS